MKKLTIWISIVSLAVFSGCANMVIVKADEDCRQSHFLFIPWGCQGPNEPIVATDRENKADEEDVYYE